MAFRKAASLPTLAQLHMLKNPVELEKTGMQLPSYTLFSCNWVLSKKPASCSCSQSFWTVSTGSTATRAKPSRLQRSC